MYFLDNKIIELIRSFHQARKDEAGVEKCNAFRSEIKQRMREHKKPIIFFGVDLSYLDFSGLDLTDCDFSEATRHTGIIFSNAILVRANFSGRDRCQRTLLSGSCFIDADCLEANFSNTDLRNCKFSGQTNIEDIALRGAWLDESVLKIFLPKAKSFPGRRPVLRLVRISLEGIDCRGINFSDCDLKSIYFARANLDGARFGNADVLGCDFRKAKNFNPSVLQQCTNKNNCQLNSSQIKRKYQLDNELRGTRPISNFFIKRDDHTPRPPTSKRRKTCQTTPQIPERILTNMGNKQ